MTGDSSGGGRLRRPVFPLGGRLVRSEIPGAGKPGVGSRSSAPAELQELVFVPPVLAVCPTPVASVLSVLSFG